MRIKKSIGTKFVIQITAVITIIMVVVGVLIIRHQEQKFTQLLENKVEQVLKQLVISLRNPLWEMDRKQIKAVILSYLSDPDILAMRIVDNLHEETFFGKDPLTGEIVDLARDHEQPIRYADMFTPHMPPQVNIVDEGQIVGTCSVMFSSRFITSQVHEITIAVGLALVVLITVETLMILLLVRQNISRPLNTVVSVAKRVSLGEFDLHPLTMAKEMRSQDEIGILLQAFRDMVVCLDEMARVATSISHGDLRQTFHPLSDKDTLGHAFTNMTTYLTELATAATHIAGGDFTHNVEPKTEYDVLGNAFHTMRQQLHESQEALRNLNKELEERVKERTQQLHKQTIELTKAKERAEDAQRASEAANRAKSVFLANMSHELRTPLNAILGFAQVIARSRSLSSDQQENLGIIHRSGEHLLTLINQVLDLSKIEAGRMTVHAKDFDLHRLVHDVQEMFALRAETKGLHLLVEQDERVPRYVRTDEVKLRQVLVNLLNNAVKFTEEGGVAVRVRSEARSLRSAVLLCPRQRHSEDSVPHYKHIQFEIEDSGPGIAPEEIEQVFEAFGQTETGRQSQEGTGLGLPISRTFVQLMGGDMRVKSEVGHGTLFAFDIQVQVVEAAAFGSRLPTRRVVALEPGQPRYRILIVDDRWTNRQLVVKLLNPFAPSTSSGQGFELREAANGQEAIDIWETWKPHLIWMDLRMPVLDGYEATKRIKSAIRNSQSDIQTAIIAVTASSFEEERAVVVNAGCDDYLRKPFREAELFELISKHLGVRFVYEEEKQSTIDNRQSTIDKVLTPEMLAALPAEWLATLKQGAERADFLLLSSVIEHIRERDAALAAALARLVEDFEYDEILAVIQHTKKGE